MATRKTCDKCARFTGGEDCALMGDSNDVRGSGRLPDRAYGWDYEGYRAGVYVGPKFGCIHWIKKEKANGISRLIP